MSADQSAEQMTSNDNAEELREDQADTRGTELRRRMRELVADLMRDVLVAVTAASPAEIGELIEDAETNRHRNEAASAARAGDDRPGDSLNIPSKARMRSGNSDRRNGSGEIEEGRVALIPHESWALSSNDPFDITSPSELLASTDEPHPAPEFVAPAELPGDVTSDASIEPAPSPTESATALPQDKDAASERRPRIVLREGEILLSATGSGVVIRRERRIPSPPR
ncbi:MAG: hypothetical protein M3O46_21390 [Myxococcota bacterium]|nr:hypothetical protein [Myxococcota bacterium]